MPDQVEDKDNNMLEEDADVDLNRLPIKDREAIMARVTPDDSLPPDAFTLSQNEIRREMIDRGIQPKGFYNDDAARLQEELNREHTAEREARMQQKIQLAAKSYLRETVHRRRMEHERELREEVEEIAKNPQAEVWLELAKKSQTPSHATLRFNSIVTRAFARSLPFNNSLRSLNLSRNKLDDMAGKALAAMLKRNTTIQRLELENNCLGASSAKEIADALAINGRLVFLNLESNPLSDEEKDFSGIAALGDMLKKNKTLLSLNLWRTRLSVEGGKHLMAGMDHNQTLLCLDLGNNRVGNNEAFKIDQKLQHNRLLFEQTQQKAITVRQAQYAAADKEQTRQEEARKALEHEQWIDQRRLERQQDRQRQDEERQRKAKAEEDRLRQLAERKAAEAAAKAELEKKKKKKGKGKKSKK